MGTVALGILQVGVLVVMVEVTIKRKKPGRSAGGWVWP